MKKKQLLGRVILLIAALVVFDSIAFAKKNDEGLVPAYMVEGAGATNDASHQLKVTIISKKKDVSDADLGKCAVHATLFRDIDDTTNSSSLSSARKKALMGSPAAEAQHIDFFEPFFRNGDCNNYVQLVKDHQVIKSGKDYKVSAVVKVNTAQLKKDLSKMGMVKNLGSGW